MIDPTLRLDLFKITAGVIFHSGADTTISTPSATDLPSLVTLVNALATAFDAHAPNVVNATTGAGVHGTDSGHRITSPAALDLGSARMVMNEIETKLQAHAASTPAHFTPSNLTAPYFEMNGGLEEAINHANALLSQMNAHFAAAMNASD